ncbi:MAG TPA: hypothetical protein VGM29_08605, partial [Polyangiaceae bacterium]
QAPRSAHHRPARAEARDEVRDAIAERLHREQGGGCVVTIACDRGDRYFAPIKWEKRYVW